MNMVRVGAAAINFDRVLAVRDVESGGADLQPGVYVGFDVAAPGGGIAWERFEGAEADAIRRFLAASGGFLPPRVSEQSPPEGRAGDVPPSTGGRGRIVGEPRRRPR
jgi:hypothetical protein